MEANKARPMSSGRRSLSLAVLLFTFFSMHPACLGNTTTSTAAVSTTTLTTDPGTTAGLVASDTTIKSTSSATTSTSSSAPQEIITCSPVSVKLEVCEFPSSGAYECTFPSCSTLLNCNFNTSAKQNVTGPIFSLLGSAGDYFYGNATRQGSRDEIAICVNSTAFDMIPGIYQWNLGLTYSIDGKHENILLIGVHLTVNDVNEAPVIDFPGQNFTILENITVGSTIFAFNVSDPDARYPNGTAAYKNITEPFLRGQGAGGSDGFAVRKVSPQQYEVYVTKPQNATKSSSYSLQISVENFATPRLQVTNVTSITVADVNEAPQCSSDVTVNVDVTSAVGSLVGRLECWDRDVTSNFREIQYSPSTLFSLLNISSDGNITLVSAVTRDTVSMAEVVSVFAPLYPDVSTTVTVSLQVHSYPPECSSTQNNVSFPDSAAVGTCSIVTVQCSTSGPDTTLNVTNSTDGPVRWTISQGNMDTDSSLVFTVCVTDVLFHFIGQYEASLNVSNSTGVTSVTWSVTIDDVNQPPAFLSASYNIQVSENTAVQATIAQVPLVTSRAMADSTSNNVITVWDPDNVTAGFEFKGINVQSVNVTYPNSSKATTTDQSNLPVYLRNDSGPPFSFLTRSNLPAGVQLAFTLQAEDEQGLVGSNTVVTFVVSDVNQAPVCASGNFNLTVGLIRQVNDPLYTVSCTDNDVNSTLSSLTYHEYTTSDSDYQYFSISSGGDIFLEQRLPLNVTTLTYTVYVIDGGGLVANFTLFVDIDRSFPPTCTLPSPNNMILRETANTTQCDTLTIACSHRTELDHYDLTFNVTFVYNTSLFQVDQQVGGQPSSQINVTGCPNTDLFRKSASYNLSFTVSSELGTYPNTLGIVVNDVDQPPQFDQDTYMFNVSEDTSSGSTVAHVVLVSGSAVAGRNEIVVTDPDTLSFIRLDTVQATGVSLFRANGSQIAMGQSPGIAYSFPNFTVSGALTPEQYYVISLTARDVFGGLSATATVTISIYDVNEPPTCPFIYETRANLTSSIGSAIFTVNCVDNDVKAEYKSVTYGEYETHDFVYFNVSTTGDVTLTSNFLADVNRLRYDVFARDGAGLTTNVILYVDINRNFGPECIPSSQVDVSFPEDALSGACSQTLVTCTDTSGRSLPMTVRVISDATQGEIGVNDSRGSNPNTVALEACVTAPSSRLMSVGQFEITVEVNNTLNVTQVTFNVTVTDVNQPPFFSKSVYRTTVPEFVSGSSTTTLATVRSPSGSTPSSADIVDIVNDDPDTQENFTIASLQHALRAEYTNGTNYEGSFIGSEPITMSGKDIVAVTRLRPDLVYFVKITVTDGQGLSANTTLEIKVTDVNEPPSCPLKTEFSLDLLESVQTTVASVSCTDSDYNDTYRDLSYFSHQEADHAYFGVDINGDVKLVTLVPRDSSQLVLKAYSMDGGGLEDNTTLTFIIDRNHPPDCFPSYVPPDGVWENGKCFRVYPNCSDPTTPDGDKRFLTYTFTGSWTNGFRQTVQVNSTYDYAEFCYFLVTDGNFKIQLAASNGLGNHTWEQDVIVSYKKASPKFTTNRYNAVPVNETAAVGFLVETVQALVDGQSVPLVYTFTDAGTFDQYFAIDSNTGNITVLKDLSPLANTEAKFYVLATDPATSLNHSAPVVVQVTDINQSPTCSPTVINATVLWSVTPNDVITRVNCSDPDPTSRFSQLSYTIATPESSMWRSEQTAVKLLSRVLLDAMTSRYIVHVLATDTTFTATTTVIINIDRTPPKPVLRVSNVKTDTANIAWTFDQQYLPVISNFVITISDSSNIPRTFVADKTSLSYVITGLTEVQNYRVDVTANGFSANVTSDEVSFTTPPIAILQQVCAEIKLTNETWSRDLLDNTSVAFIDLGNKVENGVHNRLRSVRGYVSVDVRSFRSGSVYADLVVTYNQSLSGTAELRSELSSLVNSGSVGNLPVDSSYKPFYIGAFYIAADASLEYTSPGKISDPVVSGLYFIVTGYDVTATCSARTPGVSEPKFYWMLDGRNVTSMQSSARYVISLTRRSDNDPYKFTSSVTIKGVLTTESGQLVCKVTADVKTDSKQVALKVVRRLVTILRPPTSVVIEGSDVSLVCERRAGYDVPWQATLYRVESDGSQVQVEVANKTYQEKQANFTVQGVTSDVHYRCDVRDSIATAVSSDANIIIRQLAARLCPTDGVWTETPAGNTVQLECPRDYKDGGLQNRTCGTDGLWQEPDSSGCVRQDLEDWRTTVGQVEEGTTTNTTRDVVEGLQSSTNGSLLRGDVTVAVDILDRVAKINVDTKQAPGDDELEKFVKSANNVLQAPSDVWQNQTGKAMSLVNAVDMMGKASSGMLNSSGSRPPIESDKIVLQVGRSDRKDIVFPIPSESNSYPPWVTAANNSAFLSKDAFPSSISEVRYSAVIYRNLNNVFSGQLDQSLTGQSELSINSPILSLSLALDDVTIITPVRLTFDHITDNFTSTSCQFLNFSASAEGIWSTNDCRVTESNSTMTVCECDHLTNFAVLMSPYRPVTEIANVLNVFSIVGCSISIFCLILTLVIYFILWRHVRSDRSKLLLHLCVVLVIAYVTFLAGVNQVEHETACTVVAGLLHYLWLVAFFLMLSEGIDIFISIVHVFPTKSGLVPLLIMAYGVPLIIVGVSMGVTKMEGYGGTDFCWLSLEGGLLWAFVGPALAALVANFVFVALVIRALLSAHVMTTKDERQKAKSVVKAICVMTPILGLSWIFGVMSVNDDTVVFQVLFVIFNSLQGLMIFILHCLLSKQIREAMQHKRRRQQAQNRSTDDSTSKYMVQKQSSDFTMSSNDLDKKSISPFLQVDRQVQQMASKLSMLDNSNFMTTNDTPKVMALKNPVAVATDKTSDEGPPFNIQLNESTTDDLDNAKEEPIPTNTEPEFRIEAGNVKSLSKPSSSPSEATYATVESARGQGQVQITRDGVRPTGSNEDNAQQSNMNMRPANRETAPSWVEPAQRIGPQPARKVSQTSRSAESSSSKGSKQSRQNQGRTTQERDNNSRERARERELSKKPAANIPVLEDDQHRRLDHVYGAGARISDGNSIMGGVSAKTKGGHPSKSTENIKMTSAPRNPIYNDAVPALSPTDRWVRVAQSTKPQQQQQRRGQQHAPVRHPPHPAPFQQPRPPSPRRMATSAESLGSPHFQPFAAPRQADTRHGNKKPPPQVAAKPSRWHNDPPVDYW